ncbi:MAG: EamA/RhaT family transporter [Ruminococcaceae bacterium]|nr:EamA/RhaT family transporter [Oscillospiraceae bacterium]
MLIFGTIGIFRKYIPFPSGFIAFSRGAIGFCFILLFLAVRKKGFSFQECKKSFLPLCVSGALMGFNWILLFEAYNYTGVAEATLCYYMAPVFVMVASPFLFGEKLGAKKIICIISAVSGMVLVSGILENGFSGKGEAKGILLGIGAALLYASVVILNKKIPDVPHFEKTAIQLGTAAAVLLPYTLFAEDFGSIDFEPLGVIMLAAVGIVHTGIAYVMYFGSISRLPSQTAAIFSYIDPLSAILLSAVMLGEEITLSVFCGAVLILGSAFISETKFKKSCEKEL